MNEHINFEKVETLLENSGKRKGDFYDFVGYTRQSSSNFKAQGYIPAKHASKIAQFFGISTQILFNNDEITNINNIEEIVRTEIANNPDKYTDLINNPINNQNFSMLLSYNIKAGAGAEGFLPDTLEATKIPISNKFLNGSNADFLHIIQVAGDSMYPTVSDNDWLIIDMVSNGETCRQFEKVNGIYLINRDGLVQIKRLEFLGKKGIDIISDNQAYETKNTIKDHIELEIIGKLFKQVKDLGSLTITELSD